jgi:hypothetical protein
MACGVMLHFGSIRAITGIWAPGQPGVGYIFPAAKLLSSSPLAAPRLHGFSPALSHDFSQDAHPS